jgi:hypothetical protein
MRTNDILKNRMVSVERSVRNSEESFFEREGDGARYVAVRSDVQVGD